MFEWESYIVIANKLVEMGKTLSINFHSEAAYRSAISRAYYAVFNKAEVIYNREAKSTSSSSEYNGHKIIWRYFKQQPGLHSRRIGEMGSRLQDIRNAVDYQEVVAQGDSSYPLPLSMAAECAILDAQDLLKRLDQL